MDGSDNQSWNPNIGSQNKKVLQICIYALGKCCYLKLLTFAFNAYVLSIHVPSEPNEQK